MADVSDIQLNLIITAQNIADEALSGLRESLESITEVADAIKEAFNSLDESITETMNNIRTSVESSTEAFTPFQDAIKTVTDETSTNFDAIQASIDDVKTNISSLADAGFTTFIDSAKAAGDEVKSSIDSIISSVDDMKNAIQTPEEEIFTPLVSSAQKAAEEIKATMNEISDNIAATSEQIGGVMNGGSVAGSIAGEGTAIAGAALKKEEEGGESESIFGSIKEGGEQISSAMGEIQELGVNALMGGIAFGGIEELGNKAAEWGEQLMKLRDTMGLTGEQAEQMAAMFQASGISGDTVTRVLMTLNRQADATGKTLNATQKNLEKWGISVNEFKTENAVQQLQTLSEAYERAVKEGQGESFLADVLGGRGSQIAPFLAQFQELQEASKNIKFAPIDPEEMEKDSNALREMQMQMQQVGVEIGIALMPAIKDITKAFSDFAGAITGHESVGEALKNLVSDLGPAGTAIASFVALFTAAKIGTAIGEIVEGIRSFEIGLKRLIGLQDMGLGMFNVWVLGLAALAAAIYLVVTHWQQIKEVTMQVWNDIKDWLNNTWNEIKSAVETAWNSITTFFTNLWNGLVNFFREWGPTLLAILMPIFGIPLLIKQHWDQITAWTLSLWNDTKQIWSGLVQDVENFVVNLWDNISTSFTNGVNNAVKFIETLWDDIKNDFKAGVDDAVKTINDWGNDIRNFFSNLLNMVISFVENMWNSIRNGFINGATQAKNIISSMINDIRNFFVNLPNEALQWGENLIHGFVQGIENTINSVKSAVTSVVQSAKDYLGFHSPTKEGPGSDADTWAPNFVNMFAEGLISGQEKIKSAAAAMLAPLAQTMLAPSPAYAAGYNTATTIANTSAAGTPAINVYVSGNVTRNERELAQIVAREIWQQAKLQGRF
ncbi:hypothetical protein Tsac_2849 [Thermoanaerobacterium phage THSA-485A]|uniref:hypothetical protein n=1 Tax=Thermoanaerobacterium phage THSA-485A TaxID=1126885 RepID=UPI000263F83A|nr:hypothetical protein Tsac_2849 [Thermoanaerobacterium phage THSA-485A]AFK87702.1 hypothetical protein Tsac_2849 [Thermoanaerobacterium phage THSA-485A]